MYAAQTIFRTSQWLCGILVSIALCGCSSTQRIAPAVYTQPPASQLATIYFYRGYSMPTKANIEIDIDGERVALLPSNSFTWIRVPPGLHHITAGYPSFPDMRAKLKIELTQKTDYLIEYDSKVGTEFSWFGKLGEKTIPGVTSDGRGGYTRIRVIASDEIPRVIENSQYIVARP